MVSCNRNMIIFPLTGLFTFPSLTKNSWSHSKWMLFLGFHPWMWSTGYFIRSTFFNVRRHQHREFLVETRSPQTQLPDHEEILLHSTPSWCKCVLGTLKGHCVEPALNMWSGPMRELWLRAFLSGKQGQHLIEPLGRRKTRSNWGTGFAVIQCLLETWLPKLPHWYTYGLPRNMSFPSWRIPQMNGKILEGDGTLNVCTEVLTLTKIGLAKSHIMEEWWAKQTFDKAKIK